MTGFPEFDAFLREVPGDSGCAEAMDLLDRYADLADTDPDAARRAYPGVAVHLGQCGPCEQDLQGLLAAIRAHSTDRGETSTVAE